MGIKVTPSPNLNKVQTLWKYYETTSKIPSHLRQDNLNKSTMEKIKQAVINFLRNQENKPFVASSKGSWTTHEMADEVEKGTDVGNDMIEGMVVLTCDLIVRGKEKLPTSAVTPDTVEPTAKEGEQPWELQIIKNIWRRAYLDSEEDHVKILKEYGEKIASQERSKAIQECIDTLLKLDTKILFGGKVYMSDNIGALEKLKTKSI